MGQSRSGTQTTPVGYNAPSMYPTTSTTYRDEATKTKANNIYLEAATDSSKAPAATDPSKDFGTRLSALEDARNINPLTGEVVRKPSNFGGYKMGFLADQITKSVIPKLLEDKKARMAGEKLGGPASP